MKIDRLLGIITLLLQREKITAPELAAKFEVSRRTISRDIDDICKAGIPIITYQGGDGGISIAKGYKLDKSVLTTYELDSIITGLKSLGSVSDTTRIERLISKLTPANNAVISLKDSVIIDLSSHYKSSLSEKISLLKSAISENKLVSFDYYSEKGISSRTIEPYLISFKWTAWYVYGYCRERADFRLFKLNRLWRYNILYESFTPREIPTSEIARNDIFDDENRITVLFDRTVEYRLVEEYGPDCYKITDDGRLQFSGGYTNREFIVNWLLAFGDTATVLEPLELASKIREKAKNIILNYQHDT